MWQEVGEKHGVGAGEGEHDVVEIAKDPECGDLSVSPCWVNT